MNIDTVAILEGNTFVISDRRGDIDASPATPHGLFVDDTRFLSRWVLTVDGQRPAILSTDDVEYFEAQFFLAPSSGTVYIDAVLSLMRKRTVARGFIESLVVGNHSSIPVDIDIRIQGDADFADLFEIKDALNKKGEHYRRIDRDHLVLGYRREEYVREAWIVAPGASVDEGGVRYRLRLGPHGDWSARIEVRVVSSSEAVRRGATDRLATGEERQKRVEHALADAPRVLTDWPDLLHTYQRSIIDLAALRYFPLLAPGSLPAAGLPWFMAVFGRDSLITSLQALPFAPSLAETTLRVLAARQGTRVDAFRDEEPGKILHESRIGEMTAFAERPHSPYFGSADATPLFLILLDEYELWTGDSDLVLELEQPARAALRWLDEYGDRMRNGYVSYQRRNEESGLENQCWKDSWNSIVFRDGSLAGLPRACCEIQGYAYDARMRCARLARTFWKDSALATRLEERAGELKERFNRDFWMPGRECFALAIDGDGRQVDSITSNIGHLLWSGIVDTDKAPRIVQHLMSDPLFSGWGVRTMAEGEGGYNPIGYHVGTVWPHDNSIIALGLTRYGYREESTRIASGILQAACRLSAGADAVPGRVPDGLQPTSLGVRSTAPVHSHTARARTSRLSADCRCITASGNGMARGPRSPRTMGCGRCRRSPANRVPAPERGTNCSGILERLRNPGVTHDISRQSLRALTATNAETFARACPLRWHRACTSACDEKERLCARSSSPPVGQPFSFTAWRRP